MTMWTKQKIGDFAKVKGGKRLPTGFFVQSDKTDHPYIRVTDMKFDGLDSSDIKYVPNNAYEKIKKYTISSTDIYVSNAGTVGFVGKIPDYLSGANLTENSAKITELDKNLINQDYLIYYLRSRDGQFQIKSRVGGSSQPKLALNRIETIEVPNISVDQQSQIATTLSTYDELIENNEKRIKILEEMAQRLYTEWFVKFKFPGHEKVKMVDSSLGKIPEGWEVKKVIDSFEFIGGGTPSRKDNINYWQGGSIDWYTPTDLSNNAMFIDSSSEKITEKGLADSSAKLFPEFSVMMTSRATIGRLSINTKSATTNQGFIVCIPNESTPLYYLFYWLKQNIQHFIDLGTGSTFKELTKGKFGQIRIMIPDKNIVTTYQNKVSNLGSEILNMQMQNQVLQRTRDLLIPQLVTGRRFLKV